MIAEIIINAAYKHNKNVLENESNNGIQINTITGVNDNLYNQNYVSFTPIDNAQPSNQPAPHIYY